MMTKFRSKIRNRITKVIRIVNYIYFSLAIFGTILSVILYETDKEIEPILKMILQSLVTLTTIPMLGLIIYERRLKKSLLNIKGELPTKFNTMNFIKFCMKCAILCLHSPPGLKLTVSVTQENESISYKLENMLLLCTLFRITLLWRLIVLSSSWNSENVEKFCNEAYIFHNEWFIFKALLKDFPLTIQASMIIISSFIFSYWLRYAETPYQEFSGQEWDSIWNSFYCVIITMTTVGYGDMYPTTTFGRFIVAAVCVWGIVCFAFLATTLLVSITLQGHSLKTFKLVEKHKRYYEVMDMGQRIVVEYFRFKRSKGKFYDHQVNIDRAEKRLKDLLVNFRQLRANVLKERDNEPLDSKYDSCSTQCQDVVESSMKKFEKIPVLNKKISYLHSLLEDVERLNDECTQLAHQKLGNI